MVQDSLQKKRSGWWQFGVGMAGYAGTIIVTSLLGVRLDPPRAVLILFGLLPMIPAVWAMLGWIRAVRSQDELQQRMVGEALYWSVGLTGLLTFSYGLLEAYADLPRLSMMVVWPLICVLFVLGQAISRRRYR